MKNTYIMAIIAAIAVIAIVAAALLLTGGSSDDNGNGDTCTVSFDTGGGSYVPSQSVSKGSTATEPSTYMDGYIFQGWFTSATGGSEFDFSTKITSNMTLYAHWAENTSKSCKVTFNANGGNPGSTQTVQSGSCLVAPDNPTRSGYKFQGWYTSASGGVKYDFATPVTENFTLYAQWTADSLVKNYTVTYVYNNGTAGKTTQTVKSGDRVTGVDVPARSGYTFDGWYTSSTGGIKYDFNNTVTSDLTLYAHWTQNSSAQSYTVTFKANGGNPGNVQTVQSGDQATIPTSPTRSGYTFDGWFTSEVGGVLFDFKTPVTSDLTLYAHWTAIVPAKACTVTFKANGGSPDSTITVESGSYLPTPTTPTRAGYKLLGWFTEADGGNRYNVDTPVTSDLTLYAHWAIATQSYKVTFDANKGSPGTYEVVKSGSCATAPSNPTRAGYEFQGWYTLPSGGEKFDFTIPVTANFTLYAHWYSEIYKSYTVTFDANGGFPSHSETVESGSKVSEPSDPSRYGYEFDGWYTKKTGGSEFNFNTAIKSNLVLYAHWSVTKEKQCTVTLVDSSGDKEVYTVDYGDGFEHYVTHFGRNMMRNLGVSYSQNGTYHYAPYDDGKLSLERTSLFWTEIELDSVTQNTTLYYRFE